MNLPNIDIKELQEQKKKNFEDRLAFIRFYADWIKKTPNKEWSKQQKKILERA